MATATVAAVITPAEEWPKTILLTMRSIEPFEGFWCLPGGHPDEFETMEEALVQEVREETGLIFHQKGFLGYCNEIFPELHLHAVVLAFYGTGSGELQLHPEEVSRIAWYPLDDALQMELAFNHNQLLRHYATLLDS
jgi:8-oxo-dGTP diphosphatase